jgi:hypothetical protein
MGRALVLIVTLLVAAGCGPRGAAHVSGGGSLGYGAAGYDLARVKAWAMKVLSEPEYFGAGKICARFTRPITLSVMAGSAEDRKDLLDLVPVLHRELSAAGSSLTLVGDGDANASIEIYFVPLAEFEVIGRKKGFPVVAGNWGYFYTFWTGDNAIYKAYVLIASDKLYGDSLRHFTFEEVTQSLGLSNDSPIFPDSIFFAEGPNGGNATELSPLDRQLLRFHYRYVSPGDDQAELEDAFDESWQAAAQ